MNGEFIFPGKPGIRVGGIYLSGPMTGYEEMNYPAFFSAEDVLRAHGVMVDIFNPAKYEVEGDCSPGTDNWIDLIVGDTMIISDSMYGLILLKGWEKSVGVKHEVSTARYRGTPIITMETAMLNSAEFLNITFGGRDV